MAFGSVASLSLLDLLASRSVLTVFSSVFLVLRKVGHVHPCVEDVEAGVDPKHNWKEKEERREKEREGGSKVGLSFHFSLPSFLQLDFLIFFVLVNVRPCGLSII